MKRILSKGFTLAELLIALAILGVIATFTIPKVLTSSANSQATAIAKEVAGMISGSYQAYSLETGATTGTTLGLLTPYMNYVRTTNAAGASAGTSAFDCSAVSCIVLHSGAVVGFVGTQTFSTTASYLTINVDPDGTSTANGPGSFVLYYNGRLSTGANATGAAGGTGIARITSDPSFLTF